MNSQAETKLQEAFYVYISSHFTLKEEKEKFRSVFQTIDKNGDGTITKQELQESMKFVHSLI